MGTFLFQDSFGPAPQISGVVVPTFFEFNGPEFVSSKRKRFIVGDITYPLQNVIPAVAPNDVSSLDGFVFRTTKSRRSKAEDTIFTPWNINTIPPLTPRIATYKEIFDFGGVINNVIVNLTWNTNSIVGIVNLQSSIEISIDGSSWSVPVISNSLFVSSVRFVRVLITFTATDDKSALEFYNFQCVLNVHRENDGGTVSALSTDISGTPIVFNKSYQSIDTVTLTPQTNTVVFAVYNNLTTTGCNVFVYDTTGARVSRVVTWACRGILQ